MAMLITSPFATVDVIIEMEDHPLSRPGAPAFVLIERRFSPLGWALPGGFVDVGEPLSVAARREALEETSLDVELVTQFHSYSNPQRDPRRHTISTVFIGKAKGTPVAADDAGAIAICTEETLPPLAFDHGQILADYFEYRRIGKRPPADR